MPKRQYMEKKFQKKTQLIIDAANAICEDWRQQGYSLTLRQIYYQFVQLDIMPDSWINPAYNISQGLDPNTKNNLRNYNKLGEILNDARLAGAMDWNFIEDRTRVLRRMANWTDPTNILHDDVDQFRIDKWKRQPVYVEVWVEKDALLGVVEQACCDIEVDVPYFSCRGYTSQSEMWTTAQRLRSKMVDGRPVLIVHLGDHDPSGVQMSEDIEGRLTTFLTQDWLDFNWHIGDRPEEATTEEIFEDASEYIFDQGKTDALAERPAFEMRRVALTIEQIREFNPPPNPAKQTDSRFKWYVERFGMEDSWELDALRPDVMNDLIVSNVVEARDDALWQEDRAIEEGMREELRSIHDNYDKVQKFLKDRAKKAEAAKKRAEAKAKAAKKKS